MRDHASPFFDKRVADCATARYGRGMTSTQPVLPLNVEAELTIRHIRNITSGLHATGDTFVQSQARALNDLADALERSLTTA